MKTATLKGWLASLAIIGFIACILILFQTPIPEPSKDVLLVLIGALVGVVKDVFGYYFGSSEGSARKTELMAAPDVVLPESTTREAGFIRLPLLLTLLLVPLTFCLLSACATVKKDSPQVLAGKSLLAMEETIITTAKAGSQLCQTGKLDKATCAQIESFYILAQPAYDLAADSLITAIKLNTDQGWTNYNNSVMALTLLYNDILKVGTQTGLITGGKK